MILTLSEAEGEFPGSNLELKTKLLLSLLRLGSVVGLL
jgi:hypothetical protein